MGHFSTNVLMEVLESNHVGAGTLTSDFLDVRGWKLGTLDVTPRMDRFGIFVPTGLTPLGLGVELHMFSDVYLSVFK